MSELLWFLGICVAAAALSGIILHALRPNWSHHRIIVISASPIPAIVLALCVYLFVDAASASAHECGVDACGMAMMATTVIGGIAIWGFALGLMAGAAALRLWSKP